MYTTVIYLLQYCIAYYYLYVRGCPHKLLARTQNDRRRLKSTYANKAHHSASWIMQHFLLSSTITPSRAGQDYYISYKTTQDVPINHQFKRRERDRFLLFKALLTSHLHMRVL